MDSIHYENKVKHELFRLFFEIFATQYLVMSVWHGLEDLNPTVLNMNT